MLAAVGNCATCHTAKHGMPYAGGYPMTTGFGTIYSTNITPDVATGIGGWSSMRSAAALHEGVADARRVASVPGIAYDHFTRLTDDDVAALCLSDDHVGQ